MIINTYWNLYIYFQYILIYLILQQLIECTPSPNQLWTLIKIRNLLLPKFNIGIYVKIYATQVLAKTHFNDLCNVAKSSSTNTMSKASDVYKYTLEEDATTQFHMHQEHACSSNRSTDHVIALKLAN